jgi:anti-anti-sigma factor
LRDEDRFPTRRFLTCKSCGRAYTASLSGVDSCPSCNTPSRPEDIVGGKVKSVASGGHLLITITGSGYRMQDLEELKLHIDRALQGDPKTLAFHFDGASFLDSGTLGLLVRAVQEMTRRERPTSLVTSDAQVLESLQVMDLDRILTVHPTLEAYRQGLSRN